MKGFIYIIKNTNNQKVYIGQTSRTIQDRWEQHKNAAIRGEQQGIILYNAMRKYGIQTFYVSKLEEVDLKDINEKEKYWIKYYNSQTPNGYNVREGGEDPGRKEVYKIDPNTNQVLQCYGSAMAAAQANQIDLSLLTKVCRGERDSCKGFKWIYSEKYNKDFIKNTKTHLKNYKICQINPSTGECIKIWDSITKASSELKIQQSDISHCLSGKYRTAGGYNWCEESKLKTFKPKTKFKQVIQKDLNGNIIKIWDNAKEAASFLNKDPSSIRKAARGDRKTAYGFIWEYKV